MSVSPFLRREDPSKSTYRDGSRRPHAERIVPTPEEQRGLIEKFRHREYERRGRLGRFIQRLGDWGRKVFPFLGRGWDGFGPR